MLFAGKNSASFMIVMPRLNGAATIERCIDALNPERVLGVRLAPFLVALTFA